jgi:multidrug efflux pump subunit AcrA (membrane-fusion protein)
MKLIGDSVAVKVPVTVGLRADSVQELHSPQLSTADRVVTEGAFGLADTANVEVRGDEN